MVRAVTVGRKQLLARLHENREKHEKQYLEAYAGYKERVTQEALKLAEEAKQLKPGDQLRQIHLCAPQNHRIDYDRAIDRMEWDTSDEVMLTEGDFNTYVRDEWDWANTFRHSHSTYTG